MTTLIMAKSPTQFVDGGISELHNVPTVVRKFGPAKKFDACFLPRWDHVTGGIAIHEMAYAGKELWVVNTRFSSLCIIDGEHSFVPRWRPSFVSNLTPEDRPLGVAF